MNLACYLLIQQPRISSATHSALSLLGLFLWALVVLSLTGVLLRLALIAMRSRFALHKEKPKPETSTKATSRGYARTFGIGFLALFATSWIALASLGVQNHHKIISLEAQIAKYQAETVVEHHVAILARLDNGDFAYRSDEEPQGSAYRACYADKHNGVDTVAMLNQAVGYVADYAIWEERGLCKSILRSECGFWWKDANTHFKYVRIN
jgi:hypothetical protein